METGAAGRPWVRLNMVESVDGAASSEGRSGPLSGPADKALFFVLRALADVVLVGANTLRTEHYGPARLSEEHRSARVALGLEPVPAIAVVTASGRFDVTSSFFTQSETRPLVFTVGGGRLAVHAQLAEVADVVVAGDTRVDLDVVLRALAGRGWANVLAEGGPSLAGELFVADLVDELCVTLAPVIVSGHAPRIAHGATTLDPPGRYRLCSVLEDDGFLFLRYSRTEEPTA